MSSILGIETLVLRRHERTKLASSECREFRCIQNSYLSVDYATLQQNSGLLSQLIEEITSLFDKVSIERKFTIDKGDYSDDETPHFLHHFVAYLTFPIVT
jgi:hypothetical protein